MSVKKSNVLGFYDEMYYVQYYFIVGWSWDDFQKWLKKRFAHQSDSNRPEGCHIAFYHEKTDQNVHVIYCKASRGMKRQTTMLHECVHAAFWALGNAGVGLDKSNHEPLAYLTELLYKKGMGEK